MEISVQSLGGPVDSKFYHDDYNVIVDGHQILTIETDDPKTCTKWLSDAIKTRNNRSDGLLVGMCVDRQVTGHTARPESPYELLQICIGSHCLIFRIPPPDIYYKFDPSFLQKFFSDSRVTVVCKNMKAVAEKLQKDLGIKIANALDLNELAVKGMERSNLDLGRYDLDRLAKTVLGKRWDVVRDDWLEWFDRPVEDVGYCWYEPLSAEKIKFATVDPYLCFVIGSKLLEMIRNPPPSSNKKKSEIEKKSTSKKKKYITRTFYFPDE